VASTRAWKAEASRAAISRTTLAAASRFRRAMRFVKALSFTTVVYSSGPVTPWMWNWPLSP